MKTIQSLIALISLTLVTGAGATPSNPTVDDVHRTLEEIHYALASKNPGPEDLKIVERNLRYNLDFLNGSAQRLRCLKGDSGRYYPTSIQTGKVVGDVGYSAGHPDLAVCKSTLNTTPEGLSCFLRDNGRFYPTNPTNGNIVGSDAYSAGYPRLEECTQSIN